MRDDASGFSIRPARPEEAEALSRLAFRSKASWGYARAFMGACRTELTYTAEQIRSDAFRFAVGEREGSRVGFYALARLSPSEVELEALFVEPTHIGQGYGRALVEHAKGAAAAWGAARLVIQSDPDAEPFYRAAGAILRGQRPSESIPGRMLPLLTIGLLSADAP